MMLRWAEEGWMSNVVFVRAQSGMVVLGIGVTVMMKDTLHTGWEAGLTVAGQGLVVVGCQRPFESLVSDEAEDGRGWTGTPRKRVLEGFGAMTLLISDGFVVFVSSPRRAFLS